MRHPPRASLLLVSFHPFCTALHEQAFLKADAFLSFLCWKTLQDLSKAFEKSPSFRNSCSSTPKSYFHISTPLAVGFYNGLFIYLVLSSSLSIMQSSVSLPAPALGVRFPSFVLQGTQGRTSFIEFTKRIVIVWLLLFWLSMCLSCSVAGV